MTLQLTTDLIALGAVLQLLCQFFRISDRDGQTHYIRFHVCKAYIFMFNFCVKSTLEPDLVYGLERCDTCL
jgi:hypothetical protein